MKQEELIEHCMRLISNTHRNAHGGLPQAGEFLKISAGEDSSFFKTLSQINGNATDRFKISRVKGVLESLWNSWKAIFQEVFHLRREIQLDTVSDYLDQAESLSNDKKVHPTSPAVIIGASLEDHGFDLLTIKNNLDAYSTELRRQEKITKQDLKELFLGAVQEMTLHTEIGIMWKTEKELN